MLRRPSRDAACSCLTALPRSAARPATRLTIPSVESTRASHTAVAATIPALAAPAW